MKSTTIMIVLLTLISSTIAANDFNGQIMNVVWPDPMVYTSSSMRPWVFIRIAETMPHDSTFNFPSKTRTVNGIRADVGQPISLMPAEVRWFGHTRLK